MLAAAIGVWILGLVTLVPYGTYYLFYEAQRDQYAFLIVGVLFWIFGYWGVVGPLLAALKVRRVFRAIEQARTKGDLLATLRSAQARDVFIDLIAAENRIPRFLAAFVYRLLLRRFASLAGPAVFRRPPASALRRLLEAAGLPVADLAAQDLDNFFACGPQDAPTGVIGLEIHGADALLRSLAVAAGARRQGCGKALVAEAERHARSRGVRRLYLLTTAAEGFFKGLGYATIPRDDAPASIRGTAEFSGLCPASSALMMKDLSRDSGSL